MRQMRHVTKQISSRAVPARGIGLSLTPGRGSAAAGEMTAPLARELADVPIRPLPGTGWERLAAAVYRAATVVVPVFAVLLASGLNLQDLFAGAAATTVWFIALRSSFNGPRLSALAVGTSVVAAFGTLSGLAAVSLLAFWLPGFELTTNQLLLMAGGVFLASTFEARRQEPTSRRRLLLVGADERIRDLLAELARHPQLPLEVIGVVNDERVDSVAGSLWLGTTRELGAIVRDERPDLVVLGPEGCRAEALSHILDVASLDVRVVDVHHVYEHAFGKVPVHHLSPVWFMGVLHLYQRPYSRIVKRTFDLLVASVALLVLAPLFVIVSLIARASTSGPVFFRQLRLGEGGKVFEILKFRTMIEGAEQPGMAVWATEDDPRVTRIGRVLRRTRVDELPQLWNVLRGEMSIVGPRPERPEFLQLLHEMVPFWTRRSLVKPGITGWAQVRHGYASDVTGTADKLAYDLYYLKYRSLLFDLAIVSRTVGIVLSGFGSR
jgi:exopolysaccharide biosynthesis polyprenyl glycosylphosphotransferase